MLEPVLRCLGSIHTRCVSWLPLDLSGPIAPACAAVLLAWAFVSACLLADHQVWLVFGLWIARALAKELGQPRPPRDGRARCPACRIALAADARAMRRHLQACMRRHAGGRCCWVYGLELDGMGQKERCEHEGVCFWGASGAPLAALVGEREFVGEWVCWSPWRHRSGVESLNSPKSLSQSSSAPRPASPKTLRRAPPPRSASAAFSAHLTSVRRADGLRLGAVFGLLRALPCAPLLVQGQPRAPILLLR